MNDFSFAQIIIYIFIAFY